MAHPGSAVGIQGRTRPESSQKARKRQQVSEENGDQEKYRPGRKKEQGMKAVMSVGKHRGRVIREGSKIQPAAQHKPRPSPTGILTCSLQPTA